MGRYISYDPDVIGRYPACTAVNSPLNVASNWISYAENFVDGNLAPYFSTPFSNNNMTVRDVCIDIVYAKMGNLEIEEADKVWTSVMERLERIQRGEEQMILTSGVALDPPPLTSSALSTTSGYKPVFGPDDFADMEQSGDYVDDWVEKNR